MWQLHYCSSSQPCHAAPPGLPGPAHIENISCCRMKMTAYCLCNATCLDLSHVMLLNGDIPIRKTMSKDPLYWLDGQVVVCDAPLLLGAAGHHWTWGQGQSAPALHLVTCGIAAILHKLVAHPELDRWASLILVQRQGLLLHLAPS